MTCLDFEAALQEAHVDPEDGASLFTSRRWLWPGPTGGFATEEPGEQQKR